MHTATTHSCTQAAHYRLVFSAVVCCKDHTDRRQTTGGSGRGGEWVEQWASMAAGTQDRATQGGREYTAQGRSGRAALQPQTRAQTQARTRAQTQAQTWAQCTCTTRSGRLPVVRVDLCTQDLRHVDLDRLVKHVAVGAHATGAPFASLELQPALRPFLFLACTHAHRNGKTGVYLRACGACACAFHAFEAIGRGGTDGHTHTHRERERERNLPKPRMSLMGSVWIIAVVSLSSASRTGRRC